MVKGLSFRNLALPCVTSRSHLCFACSACPERIFSERLSFHPQLARSYLVFSKPHRVADLQHQPWHSFGIKDLHQRFSGKSASVVSLAGTTPVEGPGINRLGFPVRCHPSFQTPPKRGGTAQKTLKGSQRQNRWIIERIDSTLGRVKKCGEYVHRFRASLVCCGQIKRLQAVNRRWIILSSSPVSSARSRLVQIASMAADFLMVRMYDKERCDAYYRCKVVETKDYSEMLLV